MEQRILMVDDEQRVLDAMRRSLHGRYAVTTAASGAEGLAEMEAARDAGTPFAVVVSDMMMPIMNGAQFLTRAAQLSPDSVRMILSGQADLSSTVEAVNTAHLFRFLVKPCETTELTAALDAALRQHQLVLAERELLAGTLHGAVSVLTEVLSLANPQAFRRAGRLHTLVDSVAAALDLQDDWELALAGNLGQIGCVALPPEVVEAAVTGQDLPPAELAMYRGHPAVARRLLERIPRLERVARWVGGQAVSVDDEPVVEAGSPGSAVFAAATSMMAFLDAGQKPTIALHRLSQTGNYSEALLDALLDAAAEVAPKGQLKELPAADVRPGMVLVQDVLTVTGLVLVRKGEKVTDTLATRLHNFAASVGLVEPVHVIVGG